jgi:ABC-type multidrug transport system fused ATPase/permease subunit
MACSVNAGLNAKGSTRKRLIPWLIVRLHPYVRLLSLGFLAALAAGVIATLDPLLMRHWIDVTLPRRELLESLAIVALIASCFVGRAAINGLAALASFRVTQLVGQDLRSELLRHMTALSTDWHERTPVGEKISRIEQDIEQVAQFSADALNSILRALIFFFMNLVIMFALSWRMTLSVLPLLPLFLYVRGRFRALIQVRADRAQAEVGRASGNLAEHLGAIPQIQMLCAEEISTSRTIGVREELVSAQWSQRRTEIAFSIAVTSVMALAILSLLALGTHEYLAGIITVGTLVAFYSYATRIFEPVSLAMEVYSRSQRMMASIRRIRGVLETETSVPDKGKCRTIPSTLAQGLSCSRVCYAYANGTEVLHDISFSVAAGERVAVIGKSGSGKSSIARLLARMADPTSGEVLLDDKPAPQYALRALRSAVCYVPQNPVLFFGSIRENLLFANPGASQAQLHEAVEVAQLRSVLERLPDGLATELGPDAASLSGGERQRLAIARALLRQSPILILDESTSALDSPTEQSVFHAIASLPTIETIVVISHRLHSLTWVDRLVLLNAGRIAALGTHSSLYHESSLYRDLYDKGEDSPQEGSLRLDGWDGDLRVLAAPSS